ncbi:MAG: chemotaxis response regulator protein-glutamate methylesterase [Leptospiraceae bacterium]|nr:chemotaxis response regulator protein-glutamate methylesterase [Leptospiraceae bacterium]
MSKKIRVLIVDDQAIIRSILSRGLSKSDQIEVIGTASNAYEARDKIVELQPDVLTLDVEMPKMNGVEFLKKLIPQYYIPVVMVSSFTSEGQSITLEALDAGAVDFVTKPLGEEGGMERTINELTEKVIIASKANIKSTKTKKILAKEKKLSQKKISETNVRLIAIGASTGGTNALRDILIELPEGLPPIVIVQHMPEGFTKLFAQRLNLLSALEVVEAKSGDVLKDGVAYVAPGGESHLAIKEKNKSICVEIFQGEKVSGHRPSVDVLFQSIAETSICKNTIGVILTGMGKDGAYGLKKMFEQGSFTIGQDEKTCVVYGMPREAYLSGAISVQMPLDSIVEELVSQCQKIYDNRLSP